MVIRHGGQRVLTDTTHESTLLVGRPDNKQCTKNDHWQHRSESAHLKNLFIGTEGGA